MTALLRCIRGNSICSAYTTANHLALRIKRSAGSSALQSGPLQGPSAHTFFSLHPARLSQCPRGSFVTPSRSQALWTATSLMLKSSAISRIGLACTSAPRIEASALTTRQALRFLTSVGSSSVATSRRLASVPPTSARPGEVAACSLGSCPTTWCRFWRSSVATGLGLGFDTQPQTRGTTDDR